MPILEVNSLTVDIDGEAGRHRILDDVSISLEAGEPMGLVGESGSGKSMTLRSILGMLPPGASVVDGEIRFDGRNILSSGSGGRFDQRIRGTGISMVFQEPAIALNPVMKVGRPSPSTEDCRRSRHTTSPSSSWTASASPIPTAEHRTTRSSSPEGCVSA